MLDSALVFTGLCAMIEDVMTDLHPLAASFAVLLFTALSLFFQGKHALSRLAGFLRWIVGCMLLYCAFAALPHGQFSHFFPLLGYRPERIGEGAVWMCGAVSCCCAPLILAGEENDLRSLIRKPSTMAIPSALSLSAGVMTLLVSVWLMPVYALARPQTLGWRMMLVANMTPSVAAWSLEFLGLTLLLLLALCGSLTRAGALLARAGEKRKTPPSLPAVLSLLLVPVCFLPGQELRQALIALAPYRSAVVLITLMAFTLASRKGKRRKQHEKEALR